MCLSVTGSRADVLIIGEHRADEGQVMSGSSDKIRVDRVG